MKLKGKRIAILVDQSYQEMEVWYPYYRLQEEGATVELIGQEAQKTYPSKCGYPVTSHSNISSAESKNFQGLIIPGGWAPDYMRRNPQMVAFTQAFFKENKPVGAICHAGWMLCSARVVSNRKLTSFIAIKDDLENAGAHWVDEEVVRDGNLVTSRKPDDLPVFMRTFIGAVLES